MATFAQIVRNASGNMAGIGDGADCRECPGWLILLKRSQSDFSIKSVAVILQVMYPKRFNAL